MTLMYWAWLKNQLSLRLEIQKFSKHAFHSDIKQYHVFFRNSKYDSLMLYAQTMNSHFLHFSSLHTDMVIFCHYYIIVFFKAQDIRI